MSSLLLNRRVFVASAAALCVASPALAHRERITTTRVEWTGDGFAVTHAFHRHDAEIALSQAGLIDRPEIDSLRSRALVSMHVEETFAIDGVELSTLGAETEGNRVYVYQQANVEALPAALQIEARMLRGLWADQINAVDVVVGRNVRSLRFAGEDGIQRVDVPQG